MTDTRWLGRGLRCAELGSSCTELAERGRRNGVRLCHVLLLHLLR